MSFGIQYSKLNIYIQFIFEKFDIRTALVIWFQNRLCMACDNITTAIRATVQKVHLQSTEEHMSEEPLYGGGAQEQAAPPSPPAFSANAGAPTSLR